MKGPSLLIRIIEAGIQELIALRLGKDVPKPLARYAEGVLYFLQGKSRELSVLVESHQASDTDTETETEEHLIQALLETRLAIRKHSVRPQHGKELLRLSEQFPLWAGEIHFIVAMAASTLNDQVSCQHHYREAFDAFEKIGARRKAVKALLNSIAAESRIDPDRKLLADYHFAYQKAKRLRMYGVAGQALINISREYQLVGAHLAALKYVNRALTLLSKEIGTLSYYLALVHRAHLLVEMGRTEEAKIDVDLAQRSGFSEIEASLQVLDKIWNGTTTTADSSTISQRALPATWRERQADAERTAKRPKNEMGDLEASLIDFISQTPRSKYEIIKYLYGTRLPLSVTENRLKNVINRIRKKRPGLIAFQEGKYSISDVVGSPRRKKNAA